MFTHLFIEPSQVNAFVYCKRNWYYRHRLKIRLINEHIEIGLYLHKNHWLNTITCKSVYLISEKFKLKGVCDYFLHEEGHQIPLEIKKGVCHGQNPYKNDLMQLMCYIVFVFS